MRCSGAIRTSRSLASRSSTSWRRRWAGSCSGSEKKVLDLPPETHVTYHCELVGEAARVYRDLEEDFVAQVRNGVVTAANAMVKLLRLQQVTGGCVPTDDGIGHRIDTSKQKLLADTLEDIGPDEPVVIFCRFHADLNAIHEACQSLGYNSLELSGRRDDLGHWQGGRSAGPGGANQRGRGRSRSHAGPLLNLLLAFVFARRIRPVALAGPPARADPAGSNTSTWWRGTRWTRRSCAPLKSAPRSCRRSSRKSKTNR